MLAHFIFGERDERRREQKTHAAIECVVKSTFCFTFEFALIVEESKHFFFSKFTTPCAFVLCLCRGKFVFQFYVLKING